MARSGIPLAALTTLSLGASTLWAQGLQIESRQVRVSYDDRMSREITWLAGGEHGILVSEPASQEGLEARGLPGTVFRLEPDRSWTQRRADPEFGPVVEARVRGVFEDAGHGLKLERETRVRLLDDLPVALLDTSYWNRGRDPVHLDRVFSQRILLDRRRAEPEKPSWDLASFQGGAYRWSDDYALIRLRPGFARTNFQGVDDVQGIEGAGGGMPFVDVWGPTMGVALAHLEKTPQWLSLPVQVRDDGKVEAAITEQPLAKLGQREWLEPDESFHTVLTAVIFHHLDFHDALRTYGQLLRRRGIAIPETSPASAYEPYWKSWGFGPDFTVGRILDLLPELASIGIRMANVDDGWYDFKGDWQLNRSPGKFPRGDPDMVALVRGMHAQGFRTALWWYPLGVSPDSRLAREHPELLVQDELGGHPRDPSDLCQLCPAYEPALRHIETVIRRAVSDWGFDGLYTDFQGLDAVPPCFNPAHGHHSPLDSFQSVPKVFALIHDTLHQLRKDPYHEVCICSLPHSPYAMPFYDVANASDPVNAVQMRRRIKVEKAIRGGTFAVGDCYQVPLDEWSGFSVPQSFESAMGTGAQMTTFYADLDDEQRAVWTRWFHEYRERDLARGEYLNLYDLAFDEPEAHVVRKGGETYYGFFADVWPRNRRLELRGLDPQTVYEVEDYAHRRRLGTVAGAKPYLEIAFKESLLLRLVPLGDRR